MEIDKETGIVKITPIEEYSINGNTIFVKREDLCCPEPGPPFSKMRGVVKGLLNLKRQGIVNIGYAESSISMACWGLSWAANYIGSVQVFAFMPKYKNGQPPLLEAHRKLWESFGAVTIPIEKPNLGKINHYWGRKYLYDRYGIEKSAMIPLGIPFQETIEETAKQVIITDFNSIDFKSIVVNVGSGLICAGILKGFDKLKRYPNVYTIVCRSYKTKKAISNKIKFIFDKSGIFGGGLLGYKNFHFINTNYEYTQREECECPFPCNPYYDRKAYKWLLDNYNKVEKPILFWNIGGILNV